MPIFIKTALLIFSLNGLVVNADRSRSNPVICNTLHCFSQMIGCYQDQGCFDIVQCMAKCEDPSDAPCLFECGLNEISKNEAFQTFMTCSIDNDCIPEYEDDGFCLAMDEMAMQTLTEVDDLKGDWWVLKGQNCGQDSVWRGGYDWYPCQHGRFVQVDDGEWINNTTFCAGKDSKCESDYFVTTPKIYFTNPGVLANDYPKGEAPVVPQVKGQFHISMDFLY